MIFLRELAKKLKISEAWIKRNVYIENNVLKEEDLLRLKEYYENKRTNCGLIKSRKIEEVINKINEVA